MKIKIFLLLLTMSYAQLFSVEADTIQSIGVVTPTLDEESSTGYFIPSNMEECIEEMDEIMPEYIKDSLRNKGFKEVLSKHRYVLQWLIDNWAITDSSELVQYFSKYGFNRPATIAHGILRSYWNHVNDRPLRIEKRPSVYLNDKNLFLRMTDSLRIYNNSPAPLGALIGTDSIPNFIFMGRKFTLIDSIYDPIIKFIRDNGFEPSDSLWYIWWPRVEKFGDGVDGYPEFLTEEDVDNQFSDGGSYNADYLLIIEDANKYKMKWFMRTNKYDDDFIEYLQEKSYLTFYLIRKREVHYFDD